MVGRKIIWYGDLLRLLRDSKSAWQDELLGMALELEVSLRYTAFARRKKRICIYSLGTIYHSGSLTA
jgi:hypothetical protein